jgi:hypothetical protein
MLLLMQVEKRTLEAPFDKLPKSEELPNLPLWIKVRLTEKKRPPVSMFEPATNGAIDSSRSSPDLHYPYNNRSVSSASSVSSHHSALQMPQLPHSRPASASSTPRGHGQPQLSPTDAALLKQQRSSQLAAQRLEQVTQELEDLKFAFKREREHGQELELRVKELERALAASQSENEHLERMLQQVSMRRTRAERESTGSALEVSASTDDSGSSRSPLPQHHPEVEDSPQPTSEDRQENGEVPDPVQEFRDAYSEFKHRNENLQAVLQSP